MTTQWYQSPCDTCEGAEQVERNCKKCNGGLWSDNCSDPGCYEGKVWVECDNQKCNEGKVWHARFIPCPDCERGERVHTSSWDEESICDQ
jgi:hypothetical protein